jgi:glycine cleavage system H protein
MVVDERRFAKTHEWIVIEGDIAIIGISDFAQESLGDITYIELPEVGAEYEQGADFGVIESVKAASDLYAPVGGCVCEVNTDLAKTPEIVNHDPFGDGWMIKMKNFNPAELGSLLNSDAYDAQVDSEV